MAGRVDDVSWGGRPNSLDKSLIMIHIDLSFPSKVGVGFLTCQQILPRNLWILKQTLKTHRDSKQRKYDTALTPGPCF